MRPVRLAVIGCGIAARELHWPALRKLRSKFRIVAVCSRTEQKARSFARIVGRVPYFLDYREVLRRPGIEAVDIAVPIHLNFRMTSAALRSGKHVFLEKPIAATLSDAQHLVRLAATSPGVAMVAENFRYRAVYREGARILRAGEIGEPYAADWRVFARMTTSNKYARTAWRRRPRYPGGFIFDGGIHNIAALRVMFGEIHPYAASSRRVNPALGPADTFTMHFETAGGVMGVFTLCFSAIGMDENKLVVLGTRGTMVIENDVIAVISRKRRAERFADDGGFKEEFMDFHRAIMQSTPVRSSFAEGFEDVKTILKGLRLSR